MSSAPGLRAGLAILSLLLGQAALAQPDGRGALYAPRGADADTIAPPSPREFRAAWLATVSNIDWPSRPGLAVDSQKAELRNLLDIAQRLRLNAVIFQVRPAADAMYASKLEPWSYFLTGAMGRAPKPFYDPLAFAVDEAHQRGLELHAWFNPYRARHPADTTRRAAPNHISRKAPALTMKYGPFLWMDPGEPAVRKQTINVVLDVVKRYDIDGVHLDDYFYPYPVLDRRRREVSFPDARSWNAYRKRGGKLSRDDWRRKNVDDLVEALYTSVKRAKPWVKFGISPFGIWRPGHPQVVQGFDPYEKLFADSRRWLNEGWIDYWTPQLYWRVTAPNQPYGDLLTWWMSENTKDRHLWPGNYTGRASAAGRVTWPIAEIFDQISETRSQLGATSGNVHFPITAFRSNVDSLVERLMAGPYAEPALVPASPWLTVGLPKQPVAEAAANATGVTVTIRVPTVPVTATTAQKGATRRAAASKVPPMSSDPRWWLVRARYADGWRSQIADAHQSEVHLANDPIGGGPEYITVSAIDRVGIESQPVVVSGTRASAAVPRTGGR
jgi:uncharacterized lipoprotein YddW (UPF0748 family)